MVVYRSAMHYDINFPQIIRQQSAAAFNVRDDLQDRPLVELQALAASDRLPFDVCLLNITGDLNTGNIVRTAHLMGAGRVLLFGRNKMDGRSTVGAENYIEVRRLGGLQADLT